MQVLALAMMTGALYIVGFMSLVSSSQSARRDLRFHLVRFFSDVDLGESVCEPLCRFVSSRRQILHTLVVVVVDDASVVVVFVVDIRSAETLKRQKVKE